MNDDESYLFIYLFFEQTERVRLKECFSFLFFSFLFGCILHKKNTGKKYIYSSPCGQKINTFGRVIYFLFFYVHFILLSTKKFPFLMKRGEKSNSFNYIVCNSYDSDYDYSCPACSQRSIVITSSLYY